MITYLHRSPLRAAVALTAVAAAAVLSACGSNASDPSTSAGSASDVVAKAQAVIAPYLKPPTSIGITTSLESRPATGKTFVWMQCEQPQCAALAEFFKDATSAVGWNLETVNYKTGDPASLVAALNQALQYHPTAVSILALPHSVWSSVLPDYEDAGAAIVPLYLDDVPHDNVVVTDIAGAAQTNLAAKLLANWFIADSGGKGKALLFAIPQLDSNIAFRDAFKEAVSAGCPSCSVVDFEQSYADATSGKAPVAIVSALQREPDVGYVITATQPLANGVPEAVAAAGISGVEYAGKTAEATVMAQVASGQISAVSPTALNFAAWGAIDAALRFSEGMSQLPAAPLPTMLYTPDTAAAVSPSDSFDVPADWQDQFKKLWRVG